MSPFAHSSAAALAPMLAVMPSTSQHWRQRAERAWIMTAHMRGAHAKVEMMALAMSYEMLAVRAAQRELAEKLTRNRDH